jgi:hypothetical protein
MHPLVRFTAVLLLAACAGPAWAQVEIKPIQIKPLPVQPGGPVGIGLADPTLDLLRDKGVQKDLKLTDEQVKKVNDLVQQRADLMQNLKGVIDLKKLQEAMEGLKKSATDLVTKDQAARLAQLRIQAQGPAAFRDPNVVNELKLTDEQKAAAIQAIGEANKKRLQAMAGMKGASAEEKAKKAGEIQRDAAEDFIKQLSKDQQARWRELVGPAFDGVLPAVGSGMIRPIPPIDRLPLDKNRIDRVGG